MSSELSHPLKRISDFPDIPPELIAQTALPDREAARLMILNRAGGALRHASFAALEELFSPGEVLVLNDVKVFPARLIGRKATGGQVKLLLLRWLAADGEGESWLSLLTPPIRLGADIFLADSVTARVERVHESGEFELRFSKPVRGDLERLGRMPLPPYIQRKPEDPPELEAEDRRMYQTVYARPAAQPAGDGPWTPGAVAAPTAGLHFTDALLDKIRARGVRVHFLTLKTGWGTFRPLRDPDFRRHQMMAEEFNLPAETADAVNAARAAGKRVWAVGTTVVRVLESQADEAGRLKPGAGETALYIYPGHKFRLIDAMVTNFHLPGHTPLLLAAAFAGTEPLIQAYQAAVKEGYRFFSYGDAMAIV